MVIKRLSKNSPSFFIFCSYKCRERERARGGSRRVANFLQESILIAFDFIWKVMLSDTNFATLPDPPLRADGNDEG